MSGEGASSTERPLAGTRVRVTFEGVLTSYEDHMGSRKVDVTGVGWNGVRWVGENLLPPDAVIEPVVASHTSSATATDPS